MHDDANRCASQLIEDTVLKVEKKEYVCKKDMVEKEKVREEVKEKVARKHNPLDLSFEKVKQC